MPQSLAPCSTIQRLAAPIAEAKLDIEPTPNERQILVRFLIRLREEDELG